MTGWADVAAMDMVCDDLAEAAHADDIGRDEAIELRLSLLAHRSATNAALSAVEARIGRAIEGQPFTAGGRRYEYVPATKTTYRSEVVVSNAVTQAIVAAGEDAHKAAWLAAQSVADCYAQPSRQPKLAGLKDLGLTLGDVDEEQPGEGRKLTVAELKGGRR